VIDHAHPDGQSRVVGTYRLIRSSVALAHNGHYSASEFDITCLMNYPGEKLEVGRSCVDSAYRTRGTMQLLWQGIAGYVLYHNIVALFGCASLPGTEPDTLALPLSYLYHHHLAPPAMRPRALPGRFIDLHRMPVDHIDPREGMLSLPPLIKGYLRVGGFIGNGAVVDQQFNTTDVCIVVKREAISERYMKHYERALKENELE
jgi:putative hemolysin